ncbi:MAG: hypothetical protein J5842_02480, partial [Lachnospiraceae bacterium]|nr:hypothetical protein [Lachnospiraceae bacterium]
AQKQQMIHNLIICADEDRDLNSMFPGIPATDQLGRIIGQSFDADAYLKEKGIDYEQALQRANKIILKAEKKKDENFTKADAIEAVQESYLKILSQRAKEKGSEGYTKMEQKLQRLQELLPEDAPQDQKDRIAKRCRIYAELRAKEKETFKKLVRYEQTRKNKFLDDRIKLREKAYDSQDPNLFTDDWKAPYISEDELKAVASLITDRYFEIKESNVNEVAVAIKAIDKANSDIAKDPDFRGFIQSRLAANDPGIFEDKERLVSEYAYYKTFAKGERSRFHELANDVPFFRDRSGCKGDPFNVYEDIGESSSLLLDDDDELTGGYDHSDSKLDDEESGEILISKNKSKNKSKQESSLVSDDMQDKEIPFDKERFKTQKQDVVNLAKDAMNEIIESHKFIKPTEYLIATETVIAGMLTDSAMRKRFLDKDAGFYKNGCFDRNMMNGSINELREQMINDPIFLKIVSGCPAPKDLYTKYKKAVRAEVNHRIERDKKRTRDAKNNREKDNIRKEEAAKISITLSEATKKSLKETEEILTRINKDHKASDEMKDLLRVLKKVQNKNDVSFNDLEAVNHFAAVYHDKRQGIIFSPFTDKGKLRLDTVEKLIRNTDNELKPPRRKLEGKVHDRQMKNKRQNEALMVDRL